MSAKEMGEVMNFNKKLHFKVSQNENDSNYLFASMVNNDGYHFVAKIGRQDNSCNVFTTDQLVHAEILVAEVFGNISGVTDASLAIQNFMVSNLNCSFSGHTNASTNTIVISAQEAAQRRIHDAWNILYPQPPYPNSPVLDAWDIYGSNISVSIGLGQVLDIVLNAGGFADLFGTDANVIAAGYTADSLYLDAFVAAMGPVHGTIKSTDHPYALTSTDPVCQYTGTPLTPGNFLPALQDAATCF
jgi:hypothetical protein